jgi:hypothetical protein
LLLLHARTIAAASKPRSSEDIPELAQARVVHRGFEGGFICA